MRFQSNRLGMRHFVFIQAIVVLFALWFNFWVIPSAVTSGVKAISDSCGKTYPVEKIWSGNWFCSK